MVLRLEIPHLRAFVTVARHGHFTRAGNQLGLTQSAVSWQVKRLEERCGRSLLRRGPDGVGLTAEGREFLDDAKEVLAAHDRAVDRLRRSDLQGRVRLGCADDAVAEQLSQVLARFQRRHPGIRLETVVDTSPNLNARYDEGELDLAIIQEPAGAGLGLHLWREQPIWVRSAQTEIETLRPLPVVSFGPSCAYRAAARSVLDAAEIPWFPVLECFSITGVRAAIVSGIGVGVLAQRHVQSHAGVIVGSETLPSMPMHDFILLGAREPKNAAEQALAEIVVQAFGISVDDREA